MSLKGKKDKAVLARGLEWGDAEKGHLANRRSDGRAKELAKCCNDLSSIFRQFQVDPFSLLVRRLQEYFDAFLKNFVQKLQTEYTVF